MKSAIVLFLSALFLYACTGAMTLPFPADVATAVAEQPMRRMETESLLIYYPQAHKEDALRIANQVEGCAAALYAQVKINNRFSNQKMVIVVPDVPFNNAFVAPAFSGSRPFSVIPTSFTADFPSELGLPPDPSFIGCHEIVHYVHLMQVSGLWGWFNRWVGNVLSPQSGLESWFTEGLATYYESKLQPGSGRLNWPWWRGTFHAAFASKRINGGDLSLFQRPNPVGNHYLVGSHFVEFIAQRYGEEALWKLVQRQGGSILFPFGVALRWKTATGKSLPALIDEFADAVAKHYPPRDKVKEQSSVRKAGINARYAVAPTGREAMIVSDSDETTMLRIYDDGQLYREHRLVDIIPPHRLVIANPFLTTGLSFNADGTELYFVAIDKGQIKQDSKLLRYRVEDDALDIVIANLGGSGGGLSSDGKTYYYAHADGDKHNLAALDLSTKKARIIRQAKGRQYYDHPRPSPDGSKIASAFFDGQKFVVQILDAKTGTDLIRIAIDGPVLDPTWIDDDRLLTLASYEGRFQAHLFDLRDNHFSRLTDAPYLAFQPRVRGNTLRFLSRESWQWTLDEIPLNLPAHTTNASAISQSPTLASAPLDLGPPSVTQTFTRTPQVFSDTPYSQTDGLFVPSVHTPFFTSPSDNVSLLGLQLSGRDELGFHRWILSGQYELRGKEFSGRFEYLNAQLAPVSVRLKIERIAWNEAKEIAKNSYEAANFRSQHSLSLSASRAFRNWSLGVEALGLESNDPQNPFPQLQNKRLAGPRASLQYGVLEGTAYSGAKRGFRIQADAAYFNKELSSFDSDISDFRVQLAIVTALPLSKRHTLNFSARGRRLYGFSRSNSFLEVGGSGASSVLWQRSNKEDPSGINLDWPSPLLTFQEPLRGFEDLFFTTDRIGIIDLVYKYPFILDFGFASTLYILPSLQFRQIDFELFASGATDSFANFENHKHLAAGGSLALSMTFGVIPLRWQYQLARRFSDDRALIHSFLLGFSL